MGRKGKEDDRTEKIIRGLLRLPENRRCVNCNSSGPQYVCSTFWTFVCTNCSGIHREFTHRVKSVSMAKFSTDELFALQSGGNEHARRVYLKTWDPERDGFPNSCDLSLIRDFIKRVYVERRYTGDTPVSHNRFPRLKLSDRYDSYEPKSRNSSADRSYGTETCDRGKHRYPSDDGRSYIRESYKFGGSARGSLQDKRPEDRLHVDSTVLRRSATQMFTTADLQKERCSPRNSSAFQINKGSHTTPARLAISGDKFLNLKVRNQAESDEDKKAGISVCPKKIAPPNHGSQAIKCQAGNDTKKTSDAESTVEAPKKQVESPKKQVEAPKKQEPKNESKDPAVGDLLLEDGDVDLASPKPPEEKKVSAVPPKDTIEFLLFELCNPADSLPVDKSGPSTVGNDAQLVTTDFRIHATDKAPVTTSSNAQACSPNFFPTWPSDDIKAPMSNNNMVSHDTDRAPDTSSNPYFFASWPSDDTKASLSNNSVTSHDISTRQNPALPDTDHAEVEKLPPQSLDSGAPYGSGANRMTELPCGGGRQTVSSDVMARNLLANNDISNGLSADGEGTNSRAVVKYMDTDFHSSTRDNECKALVPTSKQPPATSLPSNIPSDVPLKFQPESSSNLVIPRVHCFTEQAQGANTYGHCNPSSAPANSMVRKELPEDIFTSLFIPVSAANGHGWQAFQNYGMGYNMHYHSATTQGPAAAFTHAPRSRNPFDQDDENSQGHGAMLPQMASTPGSIHNVGATQGIPSFSYASQSQAPGGSYMGQNFYSNCNMGSTRWEGSFGSDGRGIDMFGAFTPPANQHQVGYNGYSSSAAATPGPSGGGTGNPFG